MANIKNIPPFAAAVLTLLLAACASAPKAEMPSIVSKDGAKLYEFRVGNSKYLLNPEEGAQVLTWNYTRPDGSVRKILHWPEGAVRGSFGTTPAVYGGAPVFFPFCGMSHDGAKPNFWKAPDGRSLPMRKFGFVDNGKFEVVSFSNDGILLKFIQNDDSRKSYPFKYDFYVRYRFGEKSYRTELILRNNDDIALPWGPGYHPFFNMPWVAGTKHADYRQIVDCAAAYLVLNDKGLLRPVAFDDMSFGNASTARIHADLRSPCVKIVCDKSDEEITMILNGGKLEPYFCLVNWGIPDKTPFWAAEFWVVPPFAAGRNAPKVAPHSTGVYSVEIRR